MSKLDDLDAYFCYCASDRATTKVERGLLVHDVADCRRVIACDFGNGRQHGASVKVGEFVACGTHKGQAERAYDDLDDEA